MEVIMTVGLREVKSARDSHSSYSRAYPPIIEEGDDSLGIWAVTVLKKDRGGTGTRSGPLAREHAKNSARHHAY